MAPKFMTDVASPTEAEPQAECAELHACPECDLLQRLQHITGRETHGCIRCGAVLFRSGPDSLVVTLALLWAATILFLMANSFEIVTINMRGNLSDVSLPGAVLALWQQERPFIALIVLFTTILVPAALLALLLHLYVPLMLGLQPSGVGLTLRILHLLRPWAMTEVFVLGALVAIAKLFNYGSVQPGPSLWSLCALMPVLSAMFTAYRPDDIWARLAQEDDPS
ncbi:paraquat-inducible protein A [Chitinimonas arctica]|nr:paraquat-inducible protein A [Chitinimonas arctica]